MILTHRPLRPDDAPHVAGFPRSPEELFHMFPNGRWPFTAGQVLEAAALRRDPTVVELDGQVVGYANYAVFEPASHCAIGNVVVAPAARRRGIARFLVGTLVDRALGQYGIPEVRIGAHAANPAALLLYAAMGFVPYEVQAVPDWRGATVPLVFLRRRRP